jgi:hypothetical protein
MSAPNSAQWAHIPQALRDRQQWAYTSPEKGKAPHKAGGQLASSTAPADWMTFDAACACALQSGGHVGYMLHKDDPFACIDLDVKDDTKPEVIAGFIKAIEKFDSFTEHSASGKGWHIWVEAALGLGARHQGVEIYSQERFIICTGNVVNDKAIAKRQALIDEAVANIRDQQGHTGAAKTELVEVAPDLTNEQVWERATQASNADKFLALWNGQWQGLQKYPSQSEADQALLSLLAFYSKSNEQCRHMFRASVLGQREKATKNDDYLNRTLTTIRGGMNAKAAADAASTEHGRDVAKSIIASAFEKMVTQKGPRVAGHFRMLSDHELSQLPAQRWLVKGIIPDASVGAIYGQSGTYKSFLALDMLAHVSNGWTWFERKVKAAPCVYVPFEGHGGIPKRVAAWRLARMHQGCDEAAATTNMRFISDAMNLRDSHDRDRLVQTLTESGWAGGVLCIDTLAQAGAGIDENSSEGMGEMIAIFQELQKRLGGVVLVIHHTGKIESAGLRGWSGLRGALDFAIKTSVPDNCGVMEAEFTLDKVKDGESGRRVGFQMLSVHLGYDEDGDPTTSLTVSPIAPPQAKEESQTTVDADRDAEDDDFVCQWVKTQLMVGNYPSKNSLKKQVNDMKEQRSVTQIRVGAAIERLLACLRIAIAEDKSPTGNPYLIAVEATVAKEQPQG